MSHKIGITSALFLDTRGARWEEFSREKENYRQRSVQQQFNNGVEGEKTGDGTNSNKCTGPRKLQSHKRFLNIDARPMASFAFLPGALCFFI
jgi:hypothetical protein